MQLRFKTELTGADYVTEGAWRLASLPHCPVHPQGGCGFTRHGTYERASPPGTKIARWYCRKAHCTFSLLPDCLAARFPGTLGEIEAVVAAVEQASSIEAAADRLRRDDVTLASAVRWVRRRLVPVRRLLRTVIGLFPQRLRGSAPTIASVRAALACDGVLFALREVACLHLPALGSPLGFKRPADGSGERRQRLQQNMGPDPPR